MSHSKQLIVIITYQGISLVLFWWTFIISMNISIILLDIYHFINISVIIYIVCLIFTIGEL